MTTEEWKVWRDEMEREEAERQAQKFEANEDMFILLTAELMQAQKLLLDWKGEQQGSQVAEMAQMFRQIRRHTVQLEKGIRQYG